MKPIRSRLGRGLAALIGDVGDEVGAVDRARGQRRVPVEFLRPNPRNPRKRSTRPTSTISRRRSAKKGSSSRSWYGPCREWSMSRDHRRRTPLARLAEGGTARGAGPADGGGRPGGARARHHRERPACRPQRARRGAWATTSSIAEFDYAQQDLGRIIGKSRSHVANTLRLLKLPEPSRIVVLKGELSAGHARALLTMSDPESGRQADHREGPERPRRRADGSGRADRSRAGDEIRRRQAAKREKDPDTRALERRSKTCWAWSSASATALAAANYGSNTRPWTNWTRSAADCGIDHSPSPEPALAGYVRP